MAAALLGEGAFLAELFAELGEAQALAQNAAGADEANPLELLPLALLLNEGDDAEDADADDRQREDHHHYDDPFHQPVGYALHSGPTM